MLNPIYLSAALGLLGIAIINGQNSIWGLSVRFFPFRERIPNRAILAWNGKARSGISRV